MTPSDPGRPPGVLVDRLMLHELVNHLTIALGHSDLLLIELDADAPATPSITEIRKACQRAVDLVEHWRSLIPASE